MKKKDLAFKPLFQTFNFLEKISKKQNWLIKYIVNYDKSKFYLNNFSQCGSTRKKKREKDARILPLDEKHGLQTFVRTSKAGARDKTDNCH